MEDNESGADTLQAKVPDAALRASLAGGGSDLLTVIVEVAAPSPKVAVRADRHTGRVRLAPEPRNRGDAVAAKSAKALGDLIAELTGERPPYLSAARAYVVEATGEQLRRLAASPLVRSIQPNRRRTT